MESNTYSKITESLALMGYVVSHVGLNENGEVVARILSPDEVFKLLGLYDNLKDIPNEFTIVNQES